MNKPPCRAGHDSKRPCSGPERPWGAGLRSSTREKVVQIREKKLVNGLCKTGTTERTYSEEFVLVKITSE